MHKKSKIKNKLCVYEIVLLITSHVLIILAFLLSPVVGAKGSILSAATSIIGVWGIIMISRGNYISHYIYMIYSFMYSVVSVMAGYYGEAIIYTFVMFPIHVISAISWKNNKANDMNKTVRVNKKVPRLHSIIACVICILLTVPFYFLLSALNLLPGKMLQNVFQDNSRPSG